MEKDLASEAKKYNSAEKFSMSKIQEKYPEIQSKKHLNMIVADEVFASNEQQRLHLKAMVGEAIRMYYKEWEWKDILEWMEQLSDGDTIENILWYIDRNGVKVPIVKIWESSFSPKHKYWYVVIKDNWYYIKGHTTKHGAMSIATNWLMDYNSIPMPEKEFSIYGAGKWYDTNEIRKEIEEYEKIRKEVQ